MKRILSETHTPLIKDIDGRLVDVSDVEKLLFSAIKENAPAISRDGNFIKEGYNAQVDYLRNISQNSIGLIGKLEERERTKTGIKTLKVGYNRVFGYYIEVSNAFKDDAAARLYPQTDDCHGRKICYGRTEKSSKKRF